MVVDSAILFGVVAVDDVEEKQVDEDDNVLEESLAFDWDCVLIPSLCVVAIVVVPVVSVLP